MSTQEIVVQKLANRPGLVPVSLGLVFGLMFVYFLGFGWFMMLLLLVAAVLLLVGLDSYRIWLLLLLATTFSGFRTDLGDFTIRAEQVVFVFLGFGWFLGLMTGKVRVKKVPLLLPVILYVGVNFLSSALYSTDKAASYQGSVLLLTYVLMYVMTVIVLRQRPDKLKSAVKALLVVGGLQILFALASLATHYGGVELGGIDFRHVEAGVSGVSLQGGFQEANLLGAFMASIGLLLVALLSSRKIKMRTSVLSVGLILSIVVLALTFTRAAWLGFVAGVAVLLFMQKPKRNIFNPRAAAMILTLAVFFVAVLMPVTNALSGGTEKLNLISERISRILDFSSGSAEGRVKVQELALERCQKSKILGYGMLSFPIQIVEPQPAGAWLYSSVVQALHDTGLVGLFLLVWFQLGVLNIIIRGYRCTKEPFYRAALAGFAAANVALIIASQASSFILLGPPWVLSGIAVAMAVESGRKGEQSTKSELESNA